MYKVLGNCFTDVVLAACGLLVLPDDAATDA